MSTACGGVVAGRVFRAAISFPGGRMSGERGTDRADRTDGQPYRLLTSKIGERVDLRDMAGVD